MLTLVSSFIVLSVVNKTKQIFLFLFSFTLTHRENRASLCNDECLPVHSACWWCVGRSFNIGNFSKTMHKIFQTLCVNSRRLYTQDLLNFVCRFSKTVYAQDLSNFACWFLKTVYAQDLSNCVCWFSTAVCTRSFKLCVSILEDCVCKTSFKLSVSLLEDWLSTRSEFQTLRVEKPPLSFAFHTSFGMQPWVWHAFCSNLRD